MSAKCSNCGAPLGDGDLFCYECGARVEVSAQPAVVFCEQCGTQNAAQDRICKSCGASLVSEPLPPEPETESAQVAVSEHVLKPEPKIYPEPEHITTTAPAAAPKSSNKFILPIAIASVCMVALAVMLASFFVFRKGSSAADYEYVPCSGRSWAIGFSSEAELEKLIRSSGQAPRMDIMSAPSSNADVLMIVPLGSILNVDGWAFDIDGKDDYWFRVVDHGGYVLGWIKGHYLRLMQKNFEFNSELDKLKYDRACYARNTKKGTTLPKRKHDPASYKDVKPASGWVTVHGDDLLEKELNIRPAPGYVNDVVFVVTTYVKLQVDGWSKDAFDRNSTNRWLRVKDEGGRVIGWVSSEAGNCEASGVVYGDTPPGSSTSTSQPQRIERDSSTANSSQNYTHEYAGYGPASFQYIPCSGYVQANTKDGSLLNVRPAPGVIDPIVFQVPDNSKLRVDGWTWDEIRGNNSYWLRVVDHGGYVIGWVSQEFCNVSNVDFHGTRPYAQNWTKAQTRSGSSVLRKRDPADYPARFATGHITVTAPNHDLNVRPAPGVVDDVVFILTDKYGCKVNGWSYDQFEGGTDRVWLRLTDNHDNILGWVNAAYCDTTHVETM